MSNADVYRQYANEAIMWARAAISDDQREQLLDLAKKWRSDAETLDQDMAREANEVAKASQMASQEIDRLGDPLATDEERQLRKLRLLKGPREFRDVRINRARA